MIEVMTAEDSKKVLLMEERVAYL